MRQINWTEYTERNGVTRYRLEWVEKYGNRGRLSERPSFNKRTFGSATTMKYDAVTGLSKMLLYLEERDEVMEVREIFANEFHECFKTLAITEFKELHELNNPITRVDIKTI